jgi:hypothetical protein
MFCSTLLVPKKEGFRAQTAAISVEACKPQMNFSHVRTRGIRPCHHPIPERHKPTQQYPSLKVGQLSEISAAAQSGMPHIAQARLVLRPVGCL